MERNSKNDKNLLDFDDICLRDRLNTSFDKDNIAISDDLIARTLQAAKEENPGLYERGEGKKKSFPVLRIARAAAVLLIVFVALYAFSRLPLGNQKMSESPMNQSDTSAYDSTAAADSAPSAGMLEYAEEGTGSARKDDAGSEDGATAEKPDILAEYSTDQANTEAESQSKTSYNMNSGAFTQLYPIPADRIVSFTAEAAKQESLTADKSNAEEFYNILNAYLITDGEKDISSAWNYRIDIETDDGKTYTILVGDGIQVKEHDGESTKENYYTVEKKDDLLQSMEEFYKGLRSKK